MTRPAVTGPRFGVLLPHFGRRADPADVIAVARRAEGYGFSSVWVRDRLLAAAPHGLLLEAGGTRFLEPLLTLAAVAAATERIRLGTAVLTPIRHPVKLAQDVGTLSALSALSGGRVELGMGLGVSAADTDVLGLAGADRAERFREYMDVLRLGLTRDRVMYRGAHFVVEDAVIDPRPAEDVPIWYGGTSRAAVRRAFEYGSGWIAGRLPVETFRDRLALAGRYADEQRRTLEVATIPITVIAEDRDRARHGVEDVVAQLAHSAEGSASWVRPASGSFRTIEDLAGLLIVGGPDDCITEVAALHDLGIGHVVFDLRVMFDRIHEALQLLGERVLPAFAEGSAKERTT